MAVANPKIISGAIVKEIKIFDKGEINETCLKYMKIIGAVKTWAASEVWNSDEIYEKSFLILLDEFLEEEWDFLPKIISPKVAAYESWKDTVYVKWPAYPLRDSFPTNHMLPSKS